jgi:RNA polymerase-binding protein
MTSRSRPIRGTRGVSYTGEVPFEQPAPHQLARYTCARGHEFTVTLAAAATPPGSWECRCGAPAGTVQPAGKPEHERRIRLLLQRRTLAELEAMLAERLTAIRGAP